MDSADESWVNSQNKRLDLSYFKFEQMMDRLEKSSGQTVVTLNEAKTLLKQDDEVSIAVYDYWLHKRLKTVSFIDHPMSRDFGGKTRCLSCPIAATPTNTVGEDGEPRRHCSQQSVPGV